MKVNHLSHKGSMNTWVDIYFDKKVAGKIHLETFWIAEEVIKDVIVEETKDEPVKWVKRTTY